jgi:hypothetical protein
MHAKSRVASSADLYVVAVLGETERGTQRRAERCATGA